MRENNRNLIVGLPLHCVSCFEKEGPFKNNWIFKPSTFSEYTTQTNGWIVFDIMAAGDGGVFTTVQNYNLHNYCS